MDAPQDVDIQKLVARIEEIRDRIKALKTENADLRSKLSESERHLQQAQGSLQDSESLRQKVRTYESERQHLSDAVSGMVSRISEVEAELGITFGDGS